MITSVHLRNFKAHRSTRIELERFMMLVGDNVSGKTSVLDALRLQAALNPNPVHALSGDSLPDDLLRRNSERPLVLTATGSVGDKTWKARSELTVLPQSGNEPTRPWKLVLTGHDGKRQFGAEASGQGGGGGSQRDGWSAIGDTLGRASLYRFRADQIAAAAYSNRTDADVEADGKNTAVALAMMKLSNDEAFERVEVALRQLIPPLQRIRLRPANVPHSAPNLGTVVGHKLYFDFDGGTGIPAHNASHGTLIVLALLTVLHSQNRPNVILLDDLDHALHPSAQMKLVRMLKELLALEEFSPLQIVATTHSPYILDELDPSEVQAFALRDDGTVATKRLSEHPDAARVKGTLRAGQLWSLEPERDWILGDKAA
jgi:predicted ATPase